MDLYADRVHPAIAAAIPSATVTITNKAAGAERNVVTNSTGLYSVPALQAGEYEVRAESRGFRTLVHSGSVTTSTFSVKCSTLSISPT